MDKKNNMKQAMYEMFGVGAAPETAAPSPSAKQPETVSISQPIPSEKKTVEQPAAVIVPPKPKATASFLAPGTVWEGNLRSEGDVEIAGEFKGDIITKGTVLLHANIQGNLSVNSLNLSGCKLMGDVVATDVVTIGADSEICGNITAKQLTCSGLITGDLNISGLTALEETAQVNGNICTGSISVIRGAVINGSIGTQKGEK